MGIKFHQGILILAGVALLGYFYNPVERALDQKLGTPMQAHAADPKTELGKLLNEDGADPARPLMAALTRAADLYAVDPQAASKAWLDTLPMGVAREIQDWQPDAAPTRESAATALQTKFISISAADTETRRHLLELAQTPGAFDGGTLYWLGLRQLETPPGAEEPSPTELQLLKTAAHLIAENAQSKTAIESAHQQASVLYRSPEAERILEEEMGKLEEP